jgi:hypothetical protein
MYVELAAENQFLPVLEETFTEITGSMAMIETEADTLKTAEEEE